MQIQKEFARLVLAATGLTLGVVFPTAAIAQSLNFSFKFTGNMSCMSPIPVSNGAISGSGTGVMNQDGSVTADVTQSLLIFSTTVRFDSRLGSGVTTAPGGTAQVRVTGRQSLRFIWNLPNNTLLVTVNVRGRSCTATFQANLRPGMSQYSFFDGSIYHYCGKPVMNTSTCEIR